MFHRLIRLYDTLRPIGVAVHELAHAAMVILSGGKIVTLDLTGQVVHRGNYSMFEQIAISYAPLLINTGLAAMIASAAMDVPQSTIPSQIVAALDLPLPVVVLTVGLQIAALLLAFLFAATALPSVTDAKNPYQTFKRRLSNPTISGLITAPLVIVLLIIFIIPLGFAHVRSKSVMLNYVSEAVFSLCVVLQATGTIVIVDMALLREIGASIA